MAIKVSSSPLQLKQIIFSKVEVEAVDNDSAFDADFDFNGVVINTEIMTAIKEGEEADPQNFIVALKYEIPNEEGQEKIAPYTIALEAQGWFELAPIYDVEKRKDMVTINGASMIVGAMREMVSQITGRSINGPLTLPSLRFTPSDDESA
jgi:preprotein translocase subunit SecB